jgi:serine phosphatase RsbU (regulator of sigma subunit)
MPTPGIADATSAAKSLDDLIERYHRATDEFSRGNPEPVKALYAEAEDITLSNPFGPPSRGRQAVLDGLDYVSGRMSDGKVTGVDEVARYSSDELAIIHEVEHWSARFRTKFGDGEEVVPYDMRATSTFRREGDNWKLVHRHSDPIGDLHPGLDEYVRRREAEARELERIEQEMRVAQVIQHNFLPKELPDLPGWEFAAYYQPAREVGGDFYDFIELPDGAVGIVVGDVTDKGVPAAMVMAATRSVLRASAERLIEPGQVLQRVNDILCPDMPEKMFVTCLYGVLDPGSGHLRFANAGHDLPYVKTADGIVELRARGMPLGLMPGMQYEERQATLEPGDSVLLHSDGVVEAHDPERDMFGFPRLREIMVDALAGQGLIDRVLSDLEAFTGPGAEQEDDITMVTLKRSGARSGSTADAKLRDARAVGGGGDVAVHAEQVAGVVDRLHLRQPAKVLSVRLS